MSVSAASESAPDLGERQDGPSPPGGGFKSEPTGNVWLSSALIDDEVRLRPCFVNFRTTEEDVLDVMEIAAEIGQRLA